MSARRSQLIDYKLRLEKPESPQTPDGVDFHKPLTFHSLTSCQCQGELFLNGLWPLGFGRIRGTTCFAHDDFPTIAHYFTSLTTAMFSSLDVTDWIHFTMIFQLLIAIR